MSSCRCLGTRPRGDVYSLLFDLEDVSRIIVSANHCGLNHVLPQLVVDSANRSTYGTKMSKHVAPLFQVDKFHCPFCGVFAKQDWFILGFGRRQQAATENVFGPLLEGFQTCRCGFCNRHSIWLNGQMLYPDSGTVDLPHEEMPADVKADFDEARSIVTKSPRGAAALLRLAIQKLMVDLGESGKNIDGDIKSMVAKGLDPMIQQALDSVRVIGNEAVHPGTIDLNDTPELAKSLFGLLNLIVDEQLAKPKRVAAVYAKLPAAKVKAIETRDGK